MSLVTDALDQVPDRQPADSSLRNPYDYRMPARPSRKQVLMILLVVVIVLQLLALLFWPVEETPVLPDNQDTMPQSTPVPQVSVTTVKKVVVVDQPQKESVAPVEPVAPPASESPVVKAEVIVTENVIKPEPVEQPETTVTQRASSATPELVQTRSQETTQQKEPAGDNLKETQVQQVEQSALKNEASKAIITEAKPRESEAQIVQQAAKLISAGEIRQAESLLMEHRDSEVIRQNLARLYLSQKLPDKVFGLLSDSQKAESRALVALAYEQGGKPDQAGLIYRSLMESNQLEPEFMVRYAVLLENRGLHAAAKSVYSRLISENSASGQSTPLIQFVKQRIEALERMGI